jgi:hypothetical protein
MWVYIAGTIAGLVWSGLANYCLGYWYDVDFVSRERNLSLVEMASGALNLFARHLNELNL